MFYYGRYDAKKVTLDLLSQNSKILQVATALQDVYENLLKKNPNWHYRPIGIFYPWMKRPAVLSPYYFSSVEGKTASCWKPCAFPIQFSMKCQH